MPLTLHCTTCMLDKLRKFSQKFLLDNMINVRYVAALVLQIRECKRRRRMLLTILAVFMQTMMQMSLCRNCSIASMQ